MRGLRIAAAALLAAVIPLLGATPAHGALAGPCSASGTLKSTRVNYDARTIDKATLPLKDDVAWTGAVVSANGERTVAGKVRVKLPWPLPKIDIGEWGKKSTSHSNTGVYHYDFPSALAGFDIPLTGADTEPGVACAGTVIIHFKGGGFGNPAVIGTFLLMFVSAVGLVVSLRPKGA